MTFTSYEYMIINNMIIPFKSAVNMQTKTYKDHTFLMLTIDNICKILNSRFDVIIEARPLNVKPTIFTL